mmetsp:Transcript_23937/g.42469  ORF Transcript_23937/g.42469 Transcript_23937/m.42469 type:complete len:399 (-) Transcript_23937:916-2112(-)|eukprot:CAMPEP_0178810122 /NCGR_PEP_ID=MMETSP0745-20121128/18496_1 /TAXON_ID=913974 /ORGANISM="Nitzschia punctata, Strain CCMP561" /LENGTH=398 /DNA_ID=CAMNT_0020470571 /DNA_START=33 /DNA_END=1229 /DNA_ORIENTATION=+
MAMASSRNRTCVTAVSLRLVGLVLFMTCTISMVAADTEQQQANRDQQEEQRLHDILVEDWYDLVRYLVGLGFCIFGLIGLYFHQFASYYFLKTYTHPGSTVTKMGRVISCEPMTTRMRCSSSRDDQDGGDGADDDTVVILDNEAEENTTCSGYRIFVVYTAAAPTRKEYLCASSCGTGPGACGGHSTSVNKEALVETEYFQWFRTSQPQPVDSQVSLILLKNNPKSACTPELLDSHLKQAFDRKKCTAISMMGVSLVLGIVILVLASVFEILSMPHPETQRPIGWSILVVFFWFFVLGGYLFCKMLFEHFKNKVFLSAIPVPLVVKKKTSSIRREDFVILNTGGSQLEQQELGYQFQNQPQEEPPDTNEGSVHGNNHSDKDDGVLQEDLENGRSPHPY